MGPASESFVSSHLMIDSVWEDMNDDSHRIFCWLPDPWSTQCGKTWARDGQIKVVRDMCRVCPTVGRSATGLVSILITAKMWHSCGKLHCIVLHICFDSQLHIRVLSFCGQALFRSVAVDANNCRLRCRSLPKNYFIFCAAP